jgi:hypothetical protein
MLVRLKKVTGEEWQLSPNADGELLCDCPDAVYRQHETTCKHAVAMKDA